MPATRIDYLCYTNYHRVAYASNLHCFQPKVGHTRTIQLPSGIERTMVTLAMKPPLFGNGFKIASMCCSWTH